MGLGIGTILAAVSVAATATGTALSYMQGQQAAKQSELNAQAQARALQMEQERKTAELAENRRRLSIQSRRERAALASQEAGTGFMSSTGSPLAILSDTLQTQQRRTADMAEQTQLGIWQLGTERQSILAEGSARARMQRQQAGAGLLSGIASTAGSAYNLYSNRATTAKPSSY